MRNIFDFLTRQEFVFAQIPNVHPTNESTETVVKFANEIAAGRMAGIHGFVTRRKAIS